MFHLGKNKGSLLVETLMAIVILSVSLTLIIQSLVMSLRAMSYGSDYILASVELESQLAALSVSSEDYSYVKGQEVSLFEIDISRQPIALSDETGSASLEKGKVTLSWGEEFRVKQLSAETYLFKEGESDNVVQ